MERPRQFRSCEWQSRGMEIQLGEVPTAPRYPVAAIYLGESSIKDSPPGTCAACECPVRPPDTASSAHPSTSPRQETAREWSGSGMRYEMRTSVRQRERHEYSMQSPGGEAHSRMQVGPIGCAYEGTSKPVRVR